MYIRKEQEERRVMNTVINDKKIEQTKKYKYLETIINTRRDRRRTQ